MIIQTAKPAREPALRPRDDDARPLYIAPGGDTQILLDGPALSIQREERAVQLFPLRRLSRIHCAEETHWSTEALLACAKRGITIMFVDDMGTVVARLLGPPGSHDHLSHRLVDFLLLPQAMGMYEHWRQTYERRVAWWTGSRLGFAPSEREPVRCRACLQELAAHYAGNPQPGNGCGVSPWAGYRRTFRNWAWAPVVSWASPGRRPWPGI